ncbi:MAG TPA: hypothetical protein VF748_17705 [Candidatus Acidoferrum sp.]
MARPPTSARPAPNPIGNSRFITFLRWKKMNTKVARQNLEEDEAAWIENLQPIAPNLLRSVPAPNTPLTTVGGKTCAVEFVVNLNGVDYVIFFATDGSATQINANTGAQTSIAPAATFSATPDLAVFASTRLLFMDSTSGYATWDGTLFVKAGGLSPNVNVTAGGSGYTTNFAVTFSGGHGSGAAATAIVAGGAVVKINVTNAGSGYLPGDAVTVNLSAGSGTGATATVVIWPQITGTTITVGFGRVWYGNGRILGFTGTGASTGQTWDDINPADAAGTTTISDADLSHAIFAVRFLNNFLYIFGDSGIKQIGSITVSSSVTLFTILTLASDIGTTFLYTILSYNRLVLFANTAGVYGIFGASVQKISDDLDGIFENINFAVPPSAALNDIHVATVGGTPGGTLHTYLLSVSYNDPRTGTLRTIICAYQSKIWYVISVGNSVKFIAGGFIQSTLQWETFASSGADVTQILQNVSGAVQILLITALTPHNNPVFAKQVMRSGIAATTNVAQQLTMTVDTENGSQSYTFNFANPMVWLNSNRQTMVWLNNSQQVVQFQGGGFLFPDQDTEGYGKFVGNTVTGTVLGAQSLAINLIVNEYVDADPWGKSP